MQYSRKNNQLTSFPKRDQLTAGPPSNQTEAVLLQLTEVKSKNILPLLFADVSTAIYTRVTAVVLV